MKRSYDSTVEEFQQANRAFDLFTLAERQRALEHFAHLRYPSIQARFFEAVHRTITDEAMSKQRDEDLSRVDGFP